MGVYDDELEEALKNTDPELYEHVKNYDRTRKGDTELCTRQH